VVFLCRWINFAKKGIAMNLTDRINQDIKEAMKAREKEKLTALRDIKSKLLLEATKEGASDEIDEATGMKILNKLYKQRLDSAAIYKDQGRMDLHDEEMSQAVVIQEYLPAQMSEDDIRSTVQQIIEKLGVSSMADMGKVMGVATKEMAGKADGKVISSIVRELLA
jgi:hypothetical protein